MTCGHHIMNEICTAVQVGEFYSSKLQRVWFVRLEGFLGLQMFLQLLGLRVCYIDALAMHMHLIKDVVYLERSMHLIARCA